MEVNVLSQVVTDKYALYHGDCVEVLKGIPEGMIDYCLYSPPFSSLYTYSNSDRDMGNTKGHDEFFAQYRFLVTELHRVMRPGRLVSVHCMTLPQSKQTHGQIGLYDFPGDIIRAHVAAGFVYHSKVTIWKDPVRDMQRTKALGLLWKQLKKDAAMSRQGIPDEVLTFRKPGENTKPVSNTEEEFPVKEWQQYASPVWMDIQQSRTLNRKMARAEDDERHICPLQLDVIERCVRLWSKAGDTVLSPFAGIGSEGVVALEMGRRFIGAELKESYFNLARQNLDGVALAREIQTEEQADLFEAEA